MSEQKLSPLKAIRAKCLDCSCDSYQEVGNCPVTTCAIWPYRFGKGNRVGRRLSPEHLEKLQMGRVKRQEEGQAA